MDKEKRDFDDFDPQDIKRWRELLLSLKDERTQYNEQVEILKNITSAYNKDLDFRNQRISELESIVKNYAPAFGRKTPTGGYRVDQFPDIGVVSLHKERVRIKPNEEYWSQKPEFIRTKQEFDKKAFNDTYTVDLSGMIINKVTGELVENMEKVEIVKSQTLSIKLLEV